MNELISILLSRWVLAGSALAFMAPVIQPFQQVSIPQHSSIKDFVTKDNSFKRAIAKSRAESDKLLAKATVNALSIITTTLNNIR
jgi:hypothetical protein